MGFEKKLYDFEATPPPAAWDKIAETLNGLQLEDGLKKKLQHLSQNPPGETWAAIEKNLNTPDEQILAEKLLELNAEPPAGAWNHITEELDTDELSKKIAGKFSGLEVTPPAQAWSRITAELNKSSKVVPMSQKYARVFRLTAAAAVIGLMVWGGVMLFNNPAPAIADRENVIENAVDSPDQKNVIEEAVDSPITPETVFTNPNTGTSSSTTQSVEIIPQPKKNKRSFALLRSAGDKKMSEVATAANIHSSSEEITADLNSLGRNKRAGLTNEAGNTTPRYLVYLNNEGSLMKISKKLADLKCIYTKEGEVSQNALAILDRTVCNDLVKSWQEKLANSPTNFSFNPLELADILK